MSRFKHIIEIKHAPGGAKVWTRYKWMNRPLDFVTLDESLDTGRMEFESIDTKVSLRPFTMVRFKCYQVPDIMYDVDGRTDAELDAAIAVGEIKLKKVFYRLVVNPVCVMYNFRHKEGDKVEPHKTEWLLSFDTVEVTKILERRVGRLQCFTNPLNKGYTADTVEVVPRKTATPDATENDMNTILDAWGDKVPTYVSPYALGHTITVDKMLGYGSGTGLQVILGESGSNATAPSGAVYDFGIDGGTLPLNEAGDWNVRYVYRIYFKTASPATDRYGYITLGYTINAVADDTADYTITEVLTRILSSAVTRKLSTPQEFYLNGSDPLHTLDGEENTYARYMNVRAPEIVLGGTLWDLLLAACGNIHGIPRLNYNPKTDKCDTVTIDILGGTEVHPGFQDRLMAYSTQMSMDDYCGEVDCIAENLIDTVDERSGTVVEPYIGGWKSPRAALSETMISNDTALFRTSFPIYRVTKFEVDIAGVAAGYADITKYIYEESEWDALDNYSSTYPLSRAYALLYKQGGQEITELQHRVESATGVGELLTNHAIINILKKVGLTAPANYTDLRFRVTYIPYARERIKQKKTFIDPDYEDNCLIYNQSENQVESSSFGEGLSGYVEKIGQEVIQATFAIEEDIDQIPKVGMKATVFGETAYVIRVNTEYDKYIKTTVMMSKNFNRLAEAYSGLKSNYRSYDISEKQSYIREINYSEEVVIGDNMSFGGSSITEHGILAFQNVLTQGAKDTTYLFTAYPASAALVTHKSKGGDVLSSTIFSVTSKASGKSLTFSWRYTDNYGAEYQSIDATGQTAKRAMRNVRVGNINGQFYTLDAKIIPSIFDNDGFIRPLPALANEFPQFNYTTANSAYFDIAGLLVDVDNREQPIITKQLHFRTNRRNMIIGAGMSQFNPMVRDYGDLDRPRLYYFSERLNNLNSIIANDFIANYGTESGFSASNVVSKQFTLNFSAAASSSAKSWGIVQNLKDNDGNVIYSVLILGENIELAAGDKPSAVYFTFLDKAINYI